uniref:Uncharacterized protein n=1 Tax=Knipowitschia caucasica TaxID=637954 RepID=A0AAV2MQW1_KNICA
MRSESAQRKSGRDNAEPCGAQLPLSLPCVNLSGETEVAMLGQSLYIKSRGPGQLTLVWEMGGDKRGGSWESPNLIDHIQHEEDFHKGLSTEERHA